jgi:hypothetical protein
LKSRREKFDISARESLTLSDGTLEGFPFSVEDLERILMRYMRHYARAPQTLQ